MYILKYPEQTNRAIDEPWSIRQTAFYHQRRLSDQKSTFILISPYQNTKGENALVELFQRAAGDDQWARPISKVNHTLFDAYISGWRRYMAHYEEELEELVGRDPIHLAT